MMTSKRYVVLSNKSHMVAGALNEIYFKTFLGDKE